MMGRTPYVFPVSQGQSGFNLEDVGSLDVSLTGLNHYSFCLLLFWFWDQCAAGCLCIGERTVHI